MTFLFALYRYFPHGGLQRDFLRIAREAVDRGHTVNVLTTCWDGERPDWLKIELLPVRGLSNHRRMWNFGEDLKKRSLGERYDVTVGFNKLPGLDVYYAADPCYVERVAQSKGILYRFSGRYRTYAALERSVFSRESSTRILLIAEPELARFTSRYATPKERLFLLPPGISRDRVAGVDAAAVRHAKRAELGLAESDLMLLQVGSAFRTKGVDRVIRALAAQPDALKTRIRHTIAGQGEPAPFLRQARDLNVEDSVVFLGPRDDVPSLMLAADLLIHPAYTENTGTVLLEAMAAGLPVLTTENCGYAGHVKDSGGGRLVPMPYEQENLDQQLTGMLTDPDRTRYGRCGLDYVKRTDVFSMPEKAVDLIVETAKGRS